ncbi:recombinase family protein [Thermopolyspora sp. NPDC052614]|uniref:recombinase family protein n=1 Tax=Thermopolyspora sp. NPDC052614 TaxID=3155682 RepID=UPI00344315A6
MVAGPAPFPIDAITTGTRGAATRLTVRRPGGTALPRGPLLCAFLGRTSTEDKQDPTLSIPRQLQASRAALPDQAIIVAHFYDVESGRKDLAARGHGRGHERFSIPVPRDGGVADLLAEAARPDRRFDAVICESIDRIARRTYIGTQIENQLEQLGVVLFAADEPIVLDGGKRSTQILTRRVKQGVAEWYVLELLEKSWAGFETHTEQGFNIGKPPYGYSAHKIPHPVPAKRAEGATKHRLVPDPVRGPVVTQIFSWRVVERLAYVKIAERLNADPDRYPPPEPVDPARALGRWSASAVREILINPKYTGYMVWNRRATKTASGKHNPPQAWVWSSRPTHEPLVGKEIFLAAQQVAPSRERSRSSAGANTAHPATHRSYPLRSYIICAACGRRMFGKTRTPYTYYTCTPAKSHRPAGHPPAVYVREDALLAGISDFFAQRVFNPARTAYLSAAAATVQAQAETDRQARIAALSASITDIQTRRARLVRSLELTDDLTAELVRDIQLRAGKLAADQEEKTAELDRLRRAEPVRQSPELLDALPTGAPDLTMLPEEILRRLFEAFRLRVVYDKDTNIATCTITIARESLHAVQQAAQQTLNGGKEEMTAALAQLPFCAVPPAGYCTDGQQRDLRFSHHVLVINDHFRIVDRA